MITIALITYNRPYFLKEAIKGILTQTYTDFELMICDNGSDSETFELAKTFNDPRISYIRNDKNDIEFYNYPFSINTRKYLLITHDDDIMHPDFLKTLLEKAEALNLTAIACNVQIIDTSSAVVKDTLLNFDSDIVLLKDNYIKNYFSNIVPPCPTVIMRKDFLDLHQIKMNFSVGRAADQYMWFEMLNKGGVIGILNKPLYSYRVHANQDSAQFKNVMECQLFISWIGKLRSDQAWERNVLSNKIVELFYNNVWCEDIRNAALRYFKDLRISKQLSLTLFFEIKGLSIAGKSVFFRNLLNKLFRHNWQTAQTKFNPK